MEADNVPNESKSSKAVKDFVAGTIAGISGVVVGFPFDTIKVRLQTEQGKSSTVLECLLSTIRNEGIRGLYKGMTPPLLTDAAVHSVLFTVNGTVQRLCLERRKESDPTKLTLSEVTPHSLVDINDIKIGFSGAIAGIAACLIISPVELVKSRLQVQKDKSFYKGPLDCMRKVIQADGFLGLYKGFGATLVRDVPGFGVYFLSYEGMKRTLSQSSPPTTSTLLLAGGIAGAMGWLCSYPADVIKTRIQIDSGTKYKGFWDCAVKSYREGGGGLKGLSVFTKGLSPTLVRSFPTNAAIFAVYEWCVYIFNGNK